MGCHFFLQGIFLTQGSNPSLLHCRQTLYPLSHQGNVPLASLIVLKRYLVFPIVSSISLHCSLRKAFLSLLAILQTLHSDGYIFPFLLCLLLLFFSELFVRPPQTTHFAFLHFFFLGMVLTIASCTMLQTCIHSSSDTLSLRSNPLNLFFTSSI